MENSMKYINDLMSFMDSSVVNFYAVKTIRERLDANGFKCLYAAAIWFWAAVFVVLTIWCFDITDRPYCRHGYFGIGWRTKKY